MKKIPFEILSIEVDKLYDKWFDEEDLDQLDKHIKDIKDLIEAAGWTEETYLRRLFGFDKGN